MLVYRITKSPEISQFLTRCGKESVLEALATRSAPNLDQINKAEQLIVDEKLEKRLEEKTGDKLIDIMKFRRFILSLEPVEDSFLKYLLISTAYAQIGQHSKAIATLVEIYSKGADWIYYQPDSARRLPTERIENIVKKCMWILRKNLGTNLEYIVLDQYIVKNFLKSSVSIPKVVVWSLNEVRKLSLSPILGAKYVDFWFQLLLERSAFNEAIEYAHQMISRNHKEIEIDKVSNILSHIVPNDSKTRVEIRKQLAKKLGSKDLYQKSIAVRLLSNETLLEMYYALDPEKSVPLYKIKRKHYLSCLKEGIAINESIFQLLKMGSINEDLVFYIPLKQTNSKSKTLDPPK